MGRKQRSGQELYEEWCEHDTSGVPGAASYFTQSLSQEERKRLFDYDAQQKADKQKTPPKGNPLSEQPGT